MARQTETKTDISDAQAKAITALLAGQTTEQAATAAGVARQTVSYWRNHDPAFMAVYHEGRAELLGSCLDTLRLVALEALAVLRSDLAAEQPVDRARAAGIILRTWAALRVEAGRTGETNSALLGLAGW